MRERAPAKINLCLLVGPTRADGRHELVSVMQSITPVRRARDARRRARRGASARASRARTSRPRALARVPRRDRLGRARASGSRSRKRIPVAAGIGGGSADAAAALRLACRRSGLGDRGSLLELAAALGADVAGQVAPGRVLARGAGERVEPLPDPEPFGVLVLPSTAPLSTAAVYAEADRLGGLRSAAELARLDAAGRDRRQRPRARRPARSSPRSTRGARARPGGGCAPRDGVRLGADRDRPVRRARAADARGRALRADGVEALAAGPLVARGAWRRLRLSDNPGTVSRLDITYLVAGVCGVARPRRVHRPDPGARRLRLHAAWQRAVAAVLSFYVLAAMIGVGVLGAVGVYELWINYG